MNVKKKRQAYNKMTKTSNKINPDNIKNKFKTVINITVVYK